VSQAEPAAAAKDFSKPAIVILGYGLAPDGSMRAILQRRVMTGLIVAQFFPQSTIIVTGGNPQNGKTEAGQMRNMLTLLGFPADRIILEDKANSTVQNAQFSVPTSTTRTTRSVHSSTWGSADPQLLQCAQYEETPSIETNMPWPLTSLVRRVPSKLGKIVHPLNR
jgi:uncharacterized SAM-binding protein YcdF (DUF218 family)